MGFLALQELPGRRALWNRSESQIIAATADSRARGINIKLDALSRSSDAVKVRICFGLALWQATYQWDVVASRSMEQTGHSYLWS